jgi:acetamidase/formamidase
MPLKTTMANTPTGWLGLGFHEDLNEAALLALEAMVDWMQKQHGLSRPHALGLASLAVDFRITQIVNGVRGVHAVLPHNILSH